MRWYGNLLRRPPVVAAAAGTVLLLGAIGPGVSYPFGPPPGVTGAPAPADDAGATCTNCHSSFDLNSGGGSVAFKGLPDHYTPGQSYLVTITVQQSGQSRWGFEATAVKQNSDLAGGTLEPVDGNTQLLGHASGVPGAQSYVSHTTAGTRPGTPGPTDFMIRWTAPPPSSGAVQFFAAGNAANNDGGNSGDFIYTTAATVLEAAPPPPPSTVMITSGPAVAPQATSATVTWTTDQPSTGKVDFGSSPVYGRSASETAAGLNHLLTLSGLSPSSTVHYQISNTAQDGKVRQETDQSFATNPLVQVSGIMVCPSGPSQATVTWNTDVPATGAVLYGATAGYGQSTAETSLNPTTTHSVVIPNLQPASSLHFAPVSDASAAGHDKVQSPDGTFVSPAQLLGDVNGDGQVNVLDALLVLRSLVGAGDLTPLQRAAADVNLDCKVDTKDVVLIIRKALKL